MKYRKRIFKIIEKADNNDKASKTFDVFIMILIVLNIVAIVLESEVTIYDNYVQVFRVFEVISVGIFTIEYLLRVVTADILYPGTRKLNAIGKLIVRPILIVDLLAILPFYLPMFMIDLRFLRAFRLFRIMRIFKLNRYSKALNMIGKVIYKKKDTLLASLFIMGFIVLVSSILMYYVENPHQPEEFSSILSTFWWGVATLTTIGYGDIYPITALGKVMASVIAITSIGIVALPTGIISSGFFDEIKKKECKCPKCGENIYQ